jgi:8-oxo-dGTP diphosphatase
VAIEEVAKSRIWGEPALDISRSPVLNRDVADRVATVLPRRPGFAIDVVLLTPLDRHLAVLLQRAPEGALERWTVPWATGNGSEETLGDAALRVARAALPAVPGWLEQVGAFADGRRHPSELELSVAFVGAVPIGTLTSPGEDAAWFPVAELPPLAPRQRAIAAQALSVVRERVDYSPVAFRLLPSTFTLSDLQRVYEILLGQRLHKASFRRALQAAAVVEATEEWRSDGRGRPAQLFRYATKGRRARPKIVRFVGLGSR